MKTTAPRTPELLAKIEAFLDEGWRIDVACRKANTYRTYVYEWAEQMEAKAIVAGSNPAPGRL